MKLCVQTAQLTEKFGVDNAFRMIHEAGFDAVDYNIDITMPYDSIVNGELIPLYEAGEEALVEYARPFRAAAEKYGVAFHQMHAPFPTYVQNPVGSDMVMRAIKACIRVAGFLNCKYVVVHPAFLGYDDALDPHTEWDLNIARYSEMIPYAKKYGVMICLENMFTSHNGKIYGACCSDMCAANRYIDALNEIAGEKLFGFCLDTGHALLIGREIYNTIMEIAPNLVALHIHDNNGISDQHLSPYMGILDWDAFVRGLRDCGYKNALSFESGNTISVVDDELALDALKFTAAAGRLFAKRIEENGN
jgi:sugar phosphate isomerase/epimerase